MKYEINHKQLSRKKWVFFHRERFILFNQNINKRRKKIQYYPVIRKSTTTLTNGII